MKYRHPAKQKLYVLAGVIMLCAALAPGLAGAQTAPVVPSIPDAQAANLVNALIRGAATARNRADLTQNILNAVNAFTTSRTTTGNTATATNISR